MILVNFYLEFSLREWVNMMIFEEKIVKKDQIKFLDVKQKR